MKPQGMEKVTHVFGLDEPKETFRNYQNTPFYSLKSYESDYHITFMIVSLK